MNYHRTDERIANGQLVCIPIDRSSRVYIKREKLQLIVIFPFSNRSNGYQRGNYFAPYEPFVTMHHIFLLDSLTSMSSTIF